MLGKRELFQTPEYFNEYIKFRKKNISDYEKIVKSPTTERAHRTRLRYSIFREYLQLLIAYYSRGDEINVIRNLFPKVVNSLEMYSSEDKFEPFDFQNIDQYIRAIWLVSLTILLDFEDDYMDDLSRIINQTNKDNLFNTLISLKKENGIFIDNLVYPHPYKFLNEIFNKEENQYPSIIEEFLKNYYQGIEKNLLV